MKTLLEAVENPFDMDYETPLQEDYDATTYKGYTIENNNDSLEQAIIKAKETGILEYTFKFFILDKDGKQVYEATGLQAARAWIDKEQEKQRRFFIEHHLDDYLYLTLMWFASQKALKQEPVPKAVTLSYTECLEVIQHDTEEFVNDVAEDRDGVDTHTGFSGYDIINLFGKEAILDRIAKVMPEYGDAFIHVKADKDALTFTADSVDEWWE